MGQEYGETNPFPFFCDFQDPELIRGRPRGPQEGVRLLRLGRGVRRPARRLDARPRRPELVWADPARAGLRRLHRDLLRLRREWPALRDFRTPGVTLHDGSVLDVTRGEGTEDPLRIVFNLTDREQPMPPTATGLPERFRSEVALYGAAIEGADGLLLAHEFRIYGAAPPASESLP